MIYYDAVSQSIESQLMAQGKTCGSYAKKFEEEKNMIIMYYRMGKLSDIEKNRSFVRLNRKVMRKAKKL